MSKARIYIVSTPGASPRLVRAISQSQAIKHVTRPYVATAATAEDVARLMAPEIGVVIEDAGAPTEDEPS